MQPQQKLNKTIVAPLVGAWIEIQKGELTIWLSIVAPLVGAWIEILALSNLEKLNSRRSSRGSVD